MTPNILLLIGILFFLFILLLIAYYFFSESKKPIAIVFLLSSIFELAVSLLRGISFEVATLVNFPIFVFLTYLLIKRLSSKVSAEKIALSVLISPLLILCIPRIIDFNGTLVSLPEQCFHLLGVLVGYSLFKIKSNLKWFILIVTTSACLFMYVRGYDMWLNKLNFDTFTGNIEAVGVSNDIIFKDTNNHVVDVSKLKGKIVLLDFWNSKCGVCYSKFPDVQKVYNKYKNNPKVSFYAVNFFLEGIDKDGDAFRIIKERGYSFPVLVCKDQTILKELKVIVYPTVLIISKNGELIFRGDINNAENNIENLLKENY